ncbi:PLP-dependent aminotransferase family protein [Parasulfitobacter algicola]|uniref:PLP-dependent aminotransferase family protein n=1 Tax=Parasulfitobacter algicola TaxID=2614809 RepID=A0ABX2IU99_9RHOB|nr:PLP-dependent aminotransferase family protein [Sulfitobacter algicola]NSX55586.1 PLP-dependent aminotransferase family protein [Sulfitobacter algicola]
MSTIWRPVLADLSSSKYKAVAKAIQAAIDSGELEAGAKLPPVRELAWSLEMTPGTVARAYTVLTDQGILEAVVGRGTFVAAKPTCLLDDVWSRQHEPPEADSVNLFSPRLPDVGQVNAIKQALVHISKATDIDAFLHYPTRDAYLPVRQAVLSWLDDIQLGQISEQDIVLAHGGQNAISLVLQATLTGPKPVLMVEDLSYAGFRRAAETLRADVVGVPMDENGVIPEALEEIARRTGGQIFCTSPEVHNPTGKHTPLERRKKLADIAGRLGFDILEDDCYRMNTPIAPSYRALMPNRAWHVSSISKTLTPSLRVGFAIAPQGRSADLRRAAEYGFFGLARPIAEVTRLLLSDPMAKTYAHRIRERVGDYIRVAVNVLGGFDLVWNGDVPFVWLNLPSGWRAAAFCRAAETAGVQIRSADEFALRDGRAPHAVRIAVNAHVALSSFEDAMHRLRALLDNPPEQISV